MTEENKNGEKIAVFGGGCFWCTEAVFKMLKGVVSVLPGYMGGIKENPTYEEVCSGGTGHVEVVQVRYNPNEVNYRDLLTIFFGSHDSTTLNRQGNDIGTQYRSVIFYSNPEQEKEALEFIKEINNSNPGGNPTVTTVEPMVKFYEAENYHQDYFAKNPKNQYCQIIISPKLEKVQEKYAELLKDIYK